MLNKILINNIVLIKNLEINFTSGLSVFTGETGTGKSIIIDSLGLILGNRANYKLVRHGEKSANVVGIFDISNNVLLKHLLSSLSLEPSNELILRREINVNGKSIALINDTPVSLITLQKVGEMLVEIQGQFENHSLLKESNHLYLLDCYCNHKDLIEKVSNSWNIFLQKKQEFEQANNILKKNISDQEWIKDSLQQLEKVNPQDNEENELGKKRKILINQDKITSSLESSRQILEGEDGLSNQITKLSSIFNKLVDIDENDLKTIAELINETRINIEELSSLINLTSISQNKNDDNLDLIEERIYELRKQANKHNCKIDDLINIKNNLADKINNTKKDELKIKILSEELNELHKEFEKNSEILSENRKNNAIKMIGRIDNELPTLRLENAKFKIDFEKLLPENYNKNGFDKVIFKAKTNLGSNLGKLSEIASGGELSRFLLAIKVVIENNLDNKTLIFDEVDSGIGGATASAVGEKLSKIGAKYQTIVVTHSPQVTAKGLHHYQINKKTFDDKTVTQTIKLNEDQRIEEIARMLSDNKITLEAKNAAKKLLETK